MAHLAVLDGAGNTVYIRVASGDGTAGDPYLLERVDSNSAAQLTALQSLAGAVDTEMQVDVLTSALPTGAATSAKQDTQITHLATLAGAVGGTEMQADIVSSALPTGAATAANQTTIIGHVDGIEALLTTIDADTSTLAAAVSTEMQVDVVGALPAGDNNIGNVDVASIAAGENLIGLVGASDIVVTIAPTVAAEAHSAGDLLFDSTAIANAVRANGGTAIVQSITITDLGDQKAAMTLVFSDAETDFGTLGGVPDPDDTEILGVLGTVDVAATDYVDFGANSVATIKNIGMLVKAGAATTSIYVAGITKGTPTPASTSDLKIKIGLLRS